MSINARYQDIDDEEYEDGVEESSLLSTFATWFIRIGIVCAVIVAIYYLVKVQIVNLLVFMICLLVAYFFGYFFMFCVDKLSDNK